MELRIANDLKPASEHFKPLLENPWVICYEDWEAEDEEISDPVWLEQLPYHFQTTQQELLEEQQAIQEQIRLGVCVLAKDKTGKEQILPAGVIENIQMMKKKEQEDAERQRRTCEANERKRLLKRKRKAQKRAKRKR